MAQIFVSHAPQDAACAEQIRQGLEAGGYTSWRERASLSIESILYPRTIENIILSSAALVLAWSGSAAQSDWVERHLLFAQQVQKPILPVLLDGTALPNTLVAVTPINGHASCADVAAQLLPLLPSSASEDPLLKLAEQAAHQYIRERMECAKRRGKRWLPILSRRRHRPRRQMPRIPVIPAACAAKTVTLPTLTGARSAPPI